MRDIKFRAWDKQYSKMHPVTRLGFRQYEDNVSHVCIDNPSGLGLFEFVIDQVELMQYTGLKDKNGIEVYEGDVAEYRDDSNTLQTGIVVYSQIACGFYIEAFGGDDEGNQDIQLHRDYDIKIIGNVHENHELLEGVGG
jgi:uncharacterized phage protein (TIGR01671 family)